MSIKLEPEVSLASLSTALQVAAEEQEIVLVGGMALEVWRAFYSIDSRVAYLTQDIDFLGYQSAVDRVAEIFKAKGYCARYEKATMDDATASSGRIIIDVEDGSVGLDFLRCLSGLDEGKIWDTRNIIDYDGVRLVVIHPIYCMMNKIINVAWYPAKRDPAGIEQARLSIEVAKAYIQESIDASLQDIGSLESTSMRRDTLDAVKEICRFARSDVAMVVRELFPELDAIESIESNILMLRKIAPLIENQLSRESIIRMGVSAKISARLIFHKVRGRNLKDMPFRY